VLGHKRGYISETRKKLLWRAYRISPTLFRTVPSPTTYGLPFPKIGGSQPQPKTATAIISGTGKATAANLADTFIGYIRTKVHCISPYNRLMATAQRRSLSLIDAYHNEPSFLCDVNMNASEKRSWRGQGCPQCSTHLQVPYECTMCNKFCLLGCRNVVAFREWLTLYS